jgi:hypothetical protein
MHAHSHNIEYCSCGLFLLIIIRYHYLFAMVHIMSIRQVNGVVLGLPSAFQRNEATSRSSTAAAICLVPVVVGILNCLFMEDNYQGICLIRSFCLIGCYGDREGRMMIPMWAWACLHKQVSRCSLQPLLIRAQWTHCFQFNASRTLPPPFFSYFASRAIWKTLKCSWSEFIFEIYAARTVPWSQEFLYGE